MTNRFGPVPFRIRIKKGKTIVILAPHPGSHRWPPRLLGKLRRQETRGALGRIGAKDTRLRFCGWRDGARATTADRLRLRAIIGEARPSVVLATSPVDHHPDHKAAWALARRATRGTPVPVIPYCVWWRLDGRLRRERGLSKTWSARAFRSQTSAYIGDDPNGFTFDAVTFNRMLAARESVRLVGTTLLGDRRKALS